MFTKHAFAKSVLGFAVLIGSAGITGAAFADHDDDDRDDRGGSQHIPSWMDNGRGNDCRIPPWVKPDVRDIREIDRERGERDGASAGYSTGFADGYGGRDRHCHNAIDLSCESRAYQKAFLAAFECAYERGFCAGREKRERERDRDHCWRPPFRWDIHWHW